MKPKVNEFNKGFKIGGLFKTYQDYLYSYMWQEKRKFMLDKFPRCYDCNKFSTQVHHLTYERVCNEKESDLMTLCRQCHKEREKQKKNDRSTKL